MKHRNQPDGIGRVLPAALAVVAALVLGACAKTVEHPDLAVTFLPQKGAFISGVGEPLAFGQLLEMTKDADYILIGEGHKNPCDHTVQQSVLKALADSGRPLSVGLEMVAVDMQPILDDFGKGLVDVDALEDELQWAERWGYPFALFREHFAIANRYSLPVAGLNVPTRVTRIVSREGMEALSDEDRALLPVEIVPPAREQVPMLDAVFEGHRAKDADDPVQRERFHLVQAIWDSKMAEEAVRLRREFDWPVLVIAGSGHVEYGWGIARRIRRFDPGARVVSIMPWRGGSFDPDRGDVFFYCPDTYRSRMGAVFVDTGGHGLLVESVERGSRADTAGLRPGDVLLEASGIPLEHLFSLHMAGKKVHDADAPLIFTVRRRGETFKADIGKLGGRKARNAETNTQGNPE